MEDDSPRALSDESPSEDEGSSYVLSSEEEDVSSSWSDEGSELSDFETENGKKRRRLEPLPPPVRPDNVQTRKLRPPQHLRQQKPPTPSESSDSTPSTPEPGKGCRIAKKSEFWGTELIRELTNEDMERDLEVIRGMWEMSVVFHFLHVFRSQLQVILDGVRMETLERAIVGSNGRGLLADLHIGLMRGLRPRLAVDEANWTAVLARKLRSECLENEANPFTPERGNEAEDYCNASAASRVLTLKRLCDLRCCENDVRDIFDQCLKPKSKILRPPKKKHKKEVAKLSQYRETPLGQLNATTFFWLMDCQDFVDFRVYKETREYVKRGGRVRGHTRINSWEVIASDVDQLQQFGEQLPSTGTYSRNLKKKVLTDLVPQLEKRIEREERKMRAAARLRKHECNIILDLHGGYGRPARARNEAKYTFEDYERAMAEAIDEGIMESDSTDAHASPPADTDDMSLDRPPEASTSFQQDVDTPDPLNNAP